MGRVIGEDTQPLEGAVIRFHRVPALDAGPPPSRRLFLRRGEALYGGSVASDRQGAFSASGLPPGTYNYCVEADQYLDPCLWERTRRLQRSAGSSRNLPALVLRKGVRITVLLRDPLGFTVRNQNSRPGVSIGILDKSVYFPAALFARGGDALEFRITVPSERALDLWVHSRMYTLRDEFNDQIGVRGKRYPLAAGGRVPATLRQITIAGQR